MPSSIRIGTRGSQLALWQAHWVKAEIERHLPDTTVSVITIKTTGDRIQDRPLSAVGGKGLFVKEIEKALLDGDIDLAVHSMKDMPGDLPEGLVIGAVPERENPFDVLITNGNLTLTELPDGARVGTSSLRRASQIRHLRPGLITESIRGNLDTRLRKLKQGDFDAIVLAAAGLIRLGMEQVITQVLDETLMLPAVGQGALCIETRLDDPNIRPIIDCLDHPDTHIPVSAERAFLKRLEGSCHIPVACHGLLKDGRLLLTGLVASEDGTSVVKETMTGGPDQAWSLGTDLAEKVLVEGGRTILENLTI